MRQTWAALSAGLFLATVAAALPLEDDLFLLQEEDDAGEPGEDFDLAELDADLGPLLRERRSPQVKSRSD